MTEVFEKQVAELNLDRSDWQLVKFGDVAIQQKQTVDRQNTKLTRYVKGEHMKSEDLHLRKWGELTDEYLGPAFIRKFDKGDILYGSRRTYLRKVVVAPFEGITSNTTFVIKANEERIDKRLLPFIMLSEGFSQNSIRNSKGSVNPYVNWKDIAGYEFLLPKKELQLELLEILWSADVSIQKSIDLLTKSKIYKDCLIEKNLTSRSLGGILKDYCDSDGVKIGPFGSLLHKSDYQAEGIPVVMPANIIDGVISDRNIARISTQKAEQLKNYRLKENDILFPRRGDLDKRAIVSKTQEGWICGTGTIRARLDKRVSARAVFFAVTSQSINSYLLASAVGTTMLNLNASTIKNIPLHIPEGPDADIVLDNIENSVVSSNRIENYIDSHIVLSKSILNRMF
jgi:type I restriction enzyme S subunit